LVPHSKIQIIGIGDDGLDGLTRQASELIEQADVIVGTASLLASVAHHNGTKIPAGGDPAKLVETLQSIRNQRIVLLASGDPLFYGTARYLFEAMGKERFEILPHVSTMQLAFARVKESWDEAYLSNLANQPLDRVIDRIRISDRVGLFTTEELTPSIVATSLLERRIDYFTVYVCEDLGSRNECVTRGDLASIVGQTFSPLNVMILVRQRGAADRPRQMAGRRLFGNPDDAFLQAKPRRGLLTPSEIRCMALAELDLAAESVVWDVGAGTGSLAIEAAQICHRGKVFAIEMDPEDYGLMLENAKHFHCPSLVPILGRAPDAFADLPAPDAVFVGGTGRDVAQLSDASLSRLKQGGRLVVNVSSPENLVGVQQMMLNRGIEPDVSMISISRGTYQLERTRFDAINPSFLIFGRK
jgi:precorrin-6B C5,15-methyltransferase / cobalt-precorrin-6B C5,C15-methyltransferase